MNRSIFMKMIGVVVMSITLVSCALFFSTLHIFPRWFDQETSNKLAHFYDAVRSEVDHVRDQLSRTAFYIAHDSDVASAISIRAEPVLHEYAREIVKRGGVEFVTISDRDGVVVARGHSDLAGDSVRSQYNVLQALSGKPVAGVERGTVVGFSMRAGHPVKQHQQIVGVVTLGFALSSNEFVDSIKRRLGVDVSIYEGSSRVATTIMHGGQRMTGTSLNSPEVLETVLEQGRTFSGRTRIDGRTFDVVYWPVVDIQGQVVGMYAIGQDRGVVEQARSAVLRTILAVTLVIGAVMMMVGVLLARTLARPIAKATRFASSVAGGNLDEQLEIGGRDEIATLARALNTMVGNLKYQIRQAEAKTREAEQMAQEVEAASRERGKLQVQLLQAQKMEALGTLAGGIAHDFNNILQALSGNVQLLLKDAPRERPGDHPDFKRLRIMANSIERAAGLVRQLLLFSRKDEVKKEKTDLNQLVEKIAKMLRQTIPRMIEIELRLDKEAWPIKADPAQVEQLLLNLAHNAADAMPDGGRLTIETSNLPQDSDFVRTHLGMSSSPYVLLCVTDTGIGMDEAILAQVFDPFFTTKEVGKASGLGLATVYGIVKSHGGDVRCYSEPDRGTTFMIYWPALPPQEAVAEDGPEVEVIGREPLGGTETILVVDDETDIRELTAEVLETSGYRILVAASGEEALTAYADRGQDIQLVVLDLNMPGMGGWRCLLELLRLNPSVRVLVASGYSAVGSAKEAQEHGAAGFIAKPYRIDQLLAKVREVLDG